MSDWDWKDELAKLLQALTGLVKLASEKIEQELNRESGKKK